MFAGSFESDTTYWHSTMRNQFLRVRSGVSNKGCVWPQLKIRSRLVRFLLGVSVFLKDG